MSEATYGSGAAAERRRWLHKRLTEMRDADELPTTVSRSTTTASSPGRGPPTPRSRQPAARAHPTPEHQRRRAMADRPRPRATATRSPTSPAGCSTTAGPIDLHDGEYEYAETVELSPWTVDRPGRHRRVALAGGRPRPATPSAIRIPLAPLSGMSGARSCAATSSALLTGTTPIGYLGDWNPSGDDIERNVRER